MKISPYDNLPMGGDNRVDDKMMEYVEVKLEDLPEVGGASDQEYGGAADQEGRVSEASAVKDFNTGMPAKTNKAPEVGGASDQKYGGAADQEGRGASDQEDRDVPTPKEARALREVPFAKEKLSLHTEARASAKTVPFACPPKYDNLEISNFCGAEQYIMPFEETLIVPDSMPDMKNILFAEGRVDAAQPAKYVYSKEDFLAGDITLYTVYRPAFGENCPVDVVKSSVPFRTDKCWDVLPCDSFRVTLSLTGLNAEMVNERKFTVKGEICIRLIGIGRRNLRVFESCADEKLVALHDEVCAADMVFEAVDKLEISQELTIRDGRPSPSKILKESMRVSEIHRQFSAGKLVINGSIHTQILYMGVGEDDACEISCLSGKTDFTQFIPAKQGLDVGSVKISFNTSQLKTRIENKDRFLLEGELITHAAAFENKKLPSTIDAYHREKDICFDITENIFNEICDTVSGEISSREVADIGAAENTVKTLLCGSCHIVSLTGHPEKSRLIIEGALEAVLLALDEDGAPFVIRHEIPIRGSLEMNVQKFRDPFICIDAAVKDFWFDSLNGRQVEINTCLFLNVWVLCERRFCSIENLEAIDCASSGSPASMAIYVVSPGDSLWDIAKKYKCDMAELAALNGIDPKNPIPSGAKIVIAK